MTGSIEGSVSVASVLDEIRCELVALFGGGLEPGAIRVDVDVFEGTEPVIADRPLDSMGLVEVIAAIEDRFGVSLATLITGDEPMTLENVARSIAGSPP